MTLTELEHDYAALTTTAGVVDLAARRDRIEVQGSDRVDFLHKFCTNDVRSLPEGGVCEAFLLNSKGQVLFWAHLFKRPEAMVIELGGGRGAALVAHLDRYVIREQVTFADRTQEWGELLVAGLDAAAAIAELPESTFAAATAWTRGPNFTVIGPAATIASFREQRAAAGVPTCDFAALDALRIEARFPLDGIDVTDKNLAQELDRNARAIHFNKGCYLGQETVARLDALGHVNKSLATLRFAAGADAAVVPPIGTTLTLNGQAVGQVTSSAYSPSAAAPVALAFVKQGANAPGTKLESPCGLAEVVA